MNYSEMIEKYKNGELDEAKALLEDAKRVLENLRFQISLKDAEIETLRKAVIDTTIRAVEAESKQKEAAYV